MSDNVSKIVLDDSQYLPKLKQIGDAWEQAAEAEEKALKASTTAMKERVEGLDALDDAFVKSMNTAKKVKKEEDLLAKAREVANKASSQYRKTLDKVSGAVDKYTKKLKLNRTEQKKNNAERRKNVKVFNESKKALKEQLASIAILGVGVGQLGKTFKAAITVVRAWIKVLGATRIALLATGIGAFVVIFGSLVAWLSKTIEGSEFLNRKMAALGAVFDGVTKVVVGLGKGIFEALSNPMKTLQNFGKGVKNFLTNPIGTAVKVFKKLRGEVKAVSEEIQKDVRQAERIAAARQRLTREERELRVEFAKTRAEIELRKKGSDDINKTIRDRKKLAQEAFDLENGLLGKQIKLAQAAVRIQEAHNKRKGSLVTQEELDELAELQIAEQDIRQGSFTLQTELQNKINGLNKEAHDKNVAQIEKEKALSEEALEKRREMLENLRDDYKELATEVLDTLTDLELEQASPLEKVFRREEKAIQEIANTRKKFLETSKKALAEGLITDEDVQTQLDNLDIIEAVVKKKFSREADLAELPLPLKIKSDIKKFDVDLPDPSVIGKALKPVITEPIKKSFKEAFGEGLEDAVIFFEDNKEQFDAFKGFFSDLTSLFVSGIDSQIGKLDELIAKQDEKITALEEQIGVEEEARENGLAHNLDTLQKELEEEQAQREAAQKKREELEKKAAKAQAINDILQQSSSLVTASANIFKAMSSIPFVGVPLAIGFIATMFAAFAKSKIDAAKASKLYKGAGQVDEHFNTYVGHKSDLYGRGYAVTDAETGQDMGVRISGKEALVNEAVSQGVNKGFFDDLNRNPQKWRNVDIAKLVADGLSGVKETAAYADNLTKNGSSTSFGSGSSTTTVQYLSGRPTHKVVQENGITKVIDLD